MPKMTPITYDDIDLRYCVGAVILLANAGALIGTMIGIASTGYRDFPGDHVALAIVASLLATARVIHVAVEDRPAGTTSPMGFVVAILGSLQLALLFGLTYASGTFLFGSTRTATENASARAQQSSWFKSIGWRADDLQVLHWVLYALIVVVLLHWATSAVRKHMPPLSQSATLWQHSDED